MVWRNTNSVKVYLLFFDDGLWENIATRRLQQAADQISPIITSSLNIRLYYCISLLQVIDPTVKLGEFDDLSKGPKYEMADEDYVKKEGTFNTEMDDKHE